MGHRLLERGFSSEMRSLRPGLPACTPKGWARFKASPVPPQRPWDLVPLYRISESHPPAPPWTDGYIFVKDSKHRLETLMGSTINFLARNDWFCEIVVKDQKENALVL